MTEHRPMRAAGTAMLWQAFQMGGVKALYMIRLLVLAILLTPADFGLVAIALSATSFLVNLTNFGLIPAVMQTEQMDEARYNAIWSFNMVKAVIVAALTVATAPLIAKIFAEPKAVPIIQVLALRPFIESLMSIKVVAQNRNLTFRPLAILKIVEATFNATISIVLAKFFGVWAMVFGMIGGMISMVILSYWLAPHRPQIIFDWQSVRSLMKFGRWILATDVVGILGNIGFRIVVSRQLGADGLGLYYLAAQIAFLPSEVASEVVGAVAFPLFARLQSNIQRAKRAFQAILTGLMALLYPVCMLIMVLSPVLVQEVLGPKWEDTVPLIQILAFVTMMGLLADCTIPLVKGLGKPHWFAQIELVQSSTLIVMIWFFSSRLGMVSTALAWLPTSLLVQILCLSFIWRTFHDSFKEIWNLMLTILIATFAGISVSYATIHTLPNIPGLVIASMLAAFVTGSILWFGDRHYSLGLLENVAVAFPQVSSILYDRLKIASPKD